HELGALRRPARSANPALLGGRASAQEQRGAAGGDGGAGGRTERGAVIGRSIVVGLLLGFTLLMASAGAAERCAECVTAGAGYAPFRVPPGTPLAGYAGLHRRLPLPHLFSPHPPPS